MQGLRLLLGSICVLLVSGVAVPTCRLHKQKLAQIPGELNVDVVPLSQPPFSSGKDQHMVLVSCIGL
jgi:hypothetical protein